jgi:hypothetical protein
MISRHDTSMGRAIDTLYKITAFERPKMRAKECEVELRKSLGLERHRQYECDYLRACAERMREAVEFYAAGGAKNDPEGRLARAALAADEPAMCPSSGGYDDGK